MSSHATFRRLRYPLIASVMILSLLALHALFFAKTFSSTSSNQRVQNVSITQAGFIPSQFSCKAGETLILMVVNHDTQKHNFVIEPLQLHSANLASGESVSLFLSADQKGTFTYVSDAPGYPEPGYRGTLTID